MEAVRKKDVKLSIHENEPPVVNDRLCCCSVFVWAKVLAVLSAASTACLLVPAVIQATNGNYLWLGAAVPAVLLSMIMLLNVFFWHSWIVYALFSAWLSAAAAFMGLITVLTMLVFGYGVAQSCFDHPSCPDDLKSFFVASSVLLAALSSTVFAFAVVCKAAQCQKRHDDPSALSVRELRIEWTIAVWAKVLALLASVSTTCLLVPAVTQAIEGHRLWLGAAVPLMLLSMIMLLNAYFWHRWFVYAVFAAWLSAAAAFMGLITVLTMLVFGYGVAESCFDRPSCPEHLKYFIVASTVLVAALAYAVFAFAVFCKAAQCQKRLDGQYILSVRETLIEWTEAGVIIVIMAILALFTVVLFVGYGIPRA
ncbi:hypothetical protein AAVH_12288 [Aphelenchoides avenae]|nr:hypothetical protein AAVH_12288 [Aphelenchus avenae]